LRSFSASPSLVWGISALFYLYELVLRVSPSVMTEELMVSFDATSTVIGILISFYYYAYTVLQVPCGIIIDKLGAKKLLLFSAGLCVVGSCLFAGSFNIPSAQMGRLLIGAGSACAFISCLQIASRLFSKEKFVILVGLTNVMGTLGGLLGGFPVARSVNAFGWQNTTFLLAGIGVFIVLLILIFIPSNLDSTPNKPAQTSIITNVFGLLRNTQIVLAGVISSLMYLPISAFAELWIVPFFMSKHGINNELASMAAAVIFIGIAIGSVVIAMLSRRIGGYVRTLKLAAIGTAALFLVLLYGGVNNFLTSLSIVFFIGILTGAQPICFTCAKNNSTADLSGTTLALTNGIIMAMGAIFQPFLGALLDMCWNGAVSSNGIRIYDISCYTVSIVTIPIALTVAYLLTFFMKETIDLE
jgi:predicted MFS family arabinose efflux permease